MSTEEIMYPYSVTSFSRRDFLIMSLIGTSGLGLLMSGCAPRGLSRDEAGGRGRIISEWLDSANAMDVTRFLDLHSDNVEFFSFDSRNPEVGREKLWSAFQASASGHLEDAFAFGDPQMVCLQTTSIDLARSNSYVLLFNGELIEKIYEYVALYDISNDSLNQDRAGSPDPDVLASQIDHTDRLTDLLNEREIQGYLEGFQQQAVINGFLSTEPIEGLDAIQAAIDQFLQAFPNIQFRHYRTFGEGNLVCQQVIVEQGPVRSLNTVHMYREDIIIRMVEYFSHTKLIET